jgi:hypothetical protein
VAREEHKEDTKDDTKEETKDETSKKDDSRPSWEKIIDLSLGIMLVRRTFEFTDPKDPGPGNVPNYTSPMVPAIVLDASIYPLCIFGRGPLANIGLVTSFYRVLGLKSSMSSVSSEPLPTTLQDFEGGLRYRWNILGRASSPTLKAGVSLGYSFFFIEWDPNISKVPLPNITYLYLNFAIGELEWPLYVRPRWSIGANAHFDYLYVFSAGDIQRTDSGGYGDGSIGGIDLGAGVYVTFGGFFARLNTFYRRIFYNFTGRCYQGEAATGCNLASGALDIYLAFGIYGGYAF